MWAHSPARRPGLPARISPVDLSAAQTLRVRICLAETPVLEVSVNKEEDRAAVRITGVAMPTAVWETTRRSWPIDCKSPLAAFGQV